VFERRASELGGFSHLGQGTLYPDVIESASVGGPAVVIKRPSQRRRPPGGA
jgi:GMP synthase (glutamine-hydrolysing)